jgi:AcrR family transcriptional regulator
MSPRSPDANEALRAASRVRILEAALRLFSAHGYDRTTMRMIADGAGTSAGLIYNHFESKESLLRAIFEESMRDVRRSFEEADTATPGNRVEALIRAAFRILRENRAFWRLSYGVRMQASVLEGLGEALPGWTASVRETLERYLAEDGHPDPEVESAVLFALIDGVSQHYVLEPERYPLELVVERIVERYAPRGPNTPGWR